jgi:hypothetical protein
MDWVNKEATLSGLTLLEPINILNLSLNAYGDVLEDLPYIFENLGRRQVRGPSPLWGMLN